MNNDLPKGASHCLKQIVKATVVSTSGQMFTGFNHTTKDNGGVCPRADMRSGEGYDLCRDVCGQSGHAEINALLNAGEQANGGVIYIEGHTYACDACKSKCDEYGIVSIIIGAPSK